jgi:hypothetical protein
MFMDHQYAFAGQYAFPGHHVFAARPSSGLFRANAAALPPLEIVPRGLMGFPVRLMGFPIR